MPQITEDQYDALHDGGEIQIARFFENNPEFLEPNDRTRKIWQDINDDDELPLSAVWDQSLAWTQLFITGPDPSDRDAIKAVTTVIKHELIFNLSSIHNAGVFDVGKQLGGRWMIIRGLNNDGCCNQGVYFVQDETNAETCVMKVLSTEAMGSNDAAREIGVLARLSHPNIVCLIDSHVPDPTQRHAAPWLVTEYCNGGTLNDFIISWKEKKEFVPEAWVWHIFESLVAAVRYLHCGPEDSSQETWGPIIHRDIIPGNIFLTYPDPSNTNPDPASSTAPPFTITLADFDPEYCPPEGSKAAEPTDIYQIGVVLMNMYCMIDWPVQEKSKAAALERGDCWPGCKGYSENLRWLLGKCVCEDPAGRPGAEWLLEVIRQAKAGL
ncbi:Protein kinase [Pyrenophora tritici-repentis]|uniref:non-specific serine/threonine protein kinase n=1 Tax=Pyrenophora tritici-repentis TaxID=45151 RepID=A0A922T230_9PLEO|nr:Protein kinase [Pyrenophora tritici-repentis]